MIHTSLEFPRTVWPCSTPLSAIRRCKLYEYLSSEENKLAVGEALGMLVAADSALHTLSVSYCQLSDDGMRPLFAAVAQSTRLRELRCTDNDLSLEFPRVILPAVRRNVSLADGELILTDDAFHYRDDDRDLCP